MKKTLVSLVGIVGISMLFGSFANAQLILDDEVFNADGVALDGAYSKILNNYDSNRGYISPNMVKCDAIDDEVTITSPVVTDDDLYEAEGYRLFWSPYRVNQLKVGSSNADISKVAWKEFKRIPDSEEQIFSISTADGIETNRVYYAFLLPLTDYDEIGAPTEEFCFKLDENACVWGAECNTLGVAPEPEVVETQAQQEEHGAADLQEHNAACVGMDLANVTHTVNGDTVTLKWTSLGDGSTVQIAIFDPEEEIYKSLGKARMDDEKFQYKMQWDGEQNFSLTNGCKEIYYKADAKRTSEPEKVVTPATGPAENILVIAIVAIALYGLYAIFFRKSEN